MEKDTPLHEVPAYLPREIAAVLFEQEASFQVETLVLLRGAITSMEERGARLDPVQYEAVVYGMGLLAIAAVANRRQGFPGEGGPA